MFSKWDASHSDKKSADSGSSWLVNYQIPSAVSKYSLMDFMTVNDLLNPVRTYNHN